MIKQINDSFEDENAVVVGYRSLCDILWQLVGVKQALSSTTRWNFTLNI